MRITRDQYDALIEENERLTVMVEQFSVQRQWTEDVLRFSDRMQERGIPLAGADDAEEMYEDDRDRKSTIRGLNLSFGSERLGFRQWVRLDPEDCCGGYMGFLGIMLNFVVFLFMFAVILIEARQYAIWRGANISSRALFKAIDNSTFCFRWPSSDLFWETIALVLAGRIAR